MNRQSFSRLIRKAIETAEDQETFNRDLYGVIWQFLEALAANECDEPGMVAREICGAYEQWLDFQGAVEG